MEEHSRQREGHKQRLYRRKVRGALEEGRRSVITAEETAREGRKLQEQWAPCGSGGMRDRLGRPERPA